LKPTVSSYVPGKTRGRRHIGWHVTARIPGKRTNRWHGSKGLSAARFKSTRESGQYRARQASPPIRVTGNRRAGVSGASRLSIRIFSAALLDTHSARRHKLASGGRPARSGALFFTNSD